MEIWISKKNGQVKLHCFLVEFVPMWVMWLLTWQASRRRSHSPAESLPNKLVYIASIECSFSLAFFGVSYCFIGWFFYFHIPHSPRRIATHLCRLFLIDWPIKHISLISSRGKNSNNCIPMYTLCILLFIFNKEVWTWKIDTSEYLN